MPAYKTGFSAGCSAGKGVGPAAWHLDGSRHASLSMYPSPHIPLSSPPFSPSFAPPPSKRRPAADSTSRSLCSRLDAVAAHASSYDQWLYASSGDMLLSMPHLHTPARGGATVVHSDSPLAGRTALAYRAHVARLDAHRQQLHTVRQESRARPRGQAPGRAADLI